MKNLTLFSVLMTLLFLSCSGPQPLTFNPGWEDDDTFSYKQTQETETDVSVMGQQQKTIQMQVMDYEYQVQDKKEDGSTDLDVVIKGLKVETSSPMFSMQYDSENADGSGQFDQLYGPMVDHKFDLMVDKNGKVTTFSGASEMFENIKENANMPNMEQIMGSLETQFGDETLKENFASFSKFLPPNPVKVGETWTTNDTMSASMGFISNNTYTLKKRSGGKAIIEMTGEVASIPTDEPVEMMGMKITYNLKGTQSGTIEVDEKTGYTLKSVIGQKMGGTMLLNMPNMGEMEAAMELVSKTTTEKQ